MPLSFSRLGELRLQIGVNPDVYKSEFSNECLVIIRNSNPNQLGGQVKRPKIVSSVNAESFLPIIGAFNLSTRKAAYLALSLQEVASMWYLVSEHDELAVDTQVAKWLGPLRSGTLTIAALNYGSMKARQGLNEIARQAHIWAKAELAVASQISPAAFENKVQVLTEMGFDIIGTGPVREIGPLRFVEQWLKMTGLMAQFSRDAEKVLMRASPTRLDLDGYIGKEKYTVGKWLPHLYTRVTGSEFGISKSKDGDAVLETTGVAFVIACAKAIDLSPPKPATVAAYSHLYK